jgi:hypothetical protein
MMAEITSALPQDHQPQWIGTELDPRPPKASPERVLKVPSSRGLPLIRTSHCACELHILR